MTVDNDLSAASSLPVLPIPESYWVIPGRLLAGEYPAKLFAGGLTQHRLDAFLEAGMTTFINLTLEDEVEDYTGLLQERAGFYGLKVECLRFPIGDFGLPTHTQMVEILDALDLALAGGRKAYVHCYGGIGRTGVAVGCFLVRHGQTGPQAIQELGGWWRKVPKSAFHPNSPETLQQREFILRWSEP